MRRLAAMLSILAGPLAAQDAEPRPYVFTHAHGGTVQEVLAGVPVQVQLPAGPLRWQVERVGQNAVLTGESVYASPGRVPGSSAVQVFDFLLPNTGPAVILIRPEGRTGRGMGHGGRRDLHGRAFDGVFALTLVPVVSAD